jgi:hypothetical protein
MIGPKAARAFDLDQDELDRTLGKVIDLAPEQVAL